MTTTVAALTTGLLKNNASISKITGLQSGRIVESSQRSSIFCGYQIFPRLEPIALRPGRYLCGSGSKTKVVYKAEILIYHHLSFFLLFFLLPYRLLLGFSSSFPISIFSIFFSNAILVVLHGKWHWFRNHLLMALPITL